MFDLYPANPTPHGYPMVTRENWQYRNWPYHSIRRSVRYLDLNIDWRGIIRDENFICNVILRQGFFLCGVKVTKTWKSKSVR